MAADGRSETADRSGRAPDPCRRPHPGVGATERRHRGRVSSSRTGRAVEPEVLAPRLGARGGSEFSG